MSITIPDEIYERLSGASQESMRPIATEAVYSIKLGLGSGPVMGVGGTGSEHISGQGKSSGLGTISNPKIIEVPETHGATEKVDEFLYEGIISRIESSFEYELDYEQRADLNKAIKEAGLVWNSYLKKLEKPQDGKFKLIKQF